MYTNDSLSGNVGPLDASLPLKILAIMGGRPIRIILTTRNVWKGIPIVKNSSVFGEK